MGYIKLSIQPLNHSLEWFVLARDDFGIKVRFCVLLWWKETCMHNNKSKKTAKSRHWESAWWRLSDIQLLTERTLICSQIFLLNRTSACGALATAWIAEFPSLPCSFSMEHLIKDQDTESSTQDASPDGVAQDNTDIALPLMVLIVIICHLLRVQIRDRHFIKIYSHSSRYNLQFSEGCFKPAATSNSSNKCRSVCLFRNLSIDQSIHRPICHLSIYSPCIENLFIQ